MIVPLEYWEEECHKAERALLAMAKAHQTAENEACEWKESSEGYRIQLQVATDRVRALEQENERLRTALESAVTRHTECQTRLRLREQVDADCRD